MKTYLECIPCLLKTALRAITKAESNPKIQEIMLKDIMLQLQELDLSMSPPDFAYTIFSIVKNKTGCMDPYKDIKERDNKNAISLIPQVKNLINNSKDCLLTATKASIAGNIMDFAAYKDYEHNKILDYALNHEFGINQYDEFKKRLANAKIIIFIADNSGEIVFDKLLLEEVRKLNDCPIKFYVKEEAIINDAMIEDALAAKIDEIPDLEIKTIKKGFPKVNDFSPIESNTVVISKGQANYECLSDCKNIFFLLMVKCPVISEDIGVEMKKMVLKYNEMQMV